MPPANRKRLASWKEIAAYLGCDARTAVRWEKDSGLPVNRMGGKKGRSVFAYVDDIDEWLACGRPSETVDQTVIEQRARLIGRRALFVAGISLALIVTLVSLAVSAAQRGALTRVQLDSAVVRSFDDGDRLLWSSVLTSWKVADDPTLPRPTLANFAPGTKSVLVGVNELANTAEGSPVGGELVAFSDRGRVLWRYSASDDLQFGTRHYTAPWELGTWTFSDGPQPLLAVAVHHLSWWPSILSVVDGGGRVIGKFVNSGWIQYVAVLNSGAHPLLLAGGISNSRDAGILAVLDPRGLNATSPEDAGSEYQCVSCGAGKPLWYFVFPRSELNRSTFSEYNSVGPIDVLSDRILVHTSEVRQSRPQGLVIASAIYEFSLDLQLRRAEFDHHYWDLHRALEADEKLDHRVADCPERDGPSLVRAWSAATGWRDIHLPPSH